MNRILMIEDDLRLASMVRAYLAQAGFVVAVAEDATRGMAQLERSSWDLVLLDLMLPDGDGLDVCRRIRAQSGVPVIMVTARGDTADRVVGLELGADDYLAKPPPGSSCGSAGWRSIARRGACGSTASTAR